MSLNDPVADALSKINNAVKALYKQVELKKSKFLVTVLTVLKENGYIGSFEEIEDGKSGMIKVELLGTINKCSVVKPRYAVKVEELESFEQRFLPAKGFGVLILSTSKGLLTQNQAKELNVGGQIVAYCY
jgi:small subunit ribosomal protein S8